MQGETVCFARRAPSMEGSLPASQTVRLGLSPFLVLGLCVWPLCSAGTWVSSGFPGSALVFAAGVCSLKISLQAAAYCDTRGLNSSVFCLSSHETELDFFPLLWFCSKQCLWRAWAQY